MSRRKRPTVLPRRMRAACALRDESGLTTVSMAVCIFLSLALIFASAQLYRIQSAAAGIQDVADAAALAAENEVAEFMVAANTCDAVVLSMTLLSGALYGAGVVTACIPPLAELSASLVQMGQKVAQARDDFSDAACRGLEQLQRLLPFLAAANAAGVSQGNSSSGQASYAALAMLVPASGEPITRLSDGLVEAGDAVEERAPEIRDAAAEAEEAAQEAQEAKMRGFMADCGSAPGRCMYERFKRFEDQYASHVNPLYASVDAWSFEAAYERAYSYFIVRAECENPDLVAGIEQKADSVLRRQYFYYAWDELEHAQAEHAGGRVRFPELFHTMAGLRGTSLYTAASYPVTESEDGAVMHVMAACPEAAGYGRLGSIQELEAGGFTTCPSCRFVPSDLANVGSANTNVDTGFEYHYEIVRKACDEHNAALDRLEPLKQQVQGDAEGLFDQLAQVAADAGSQRIHARPPGRMGAIAMVLDTARTSADAGFESAFAPSGQTLGLRAAVSAATLVGDASDSGSSVITSLLDGFGADGGAAVGAARIALDCWSGLLRAYEDGQTALSDGLARALDGIPTATASGLGAWASDALQSAMDAAGLEPVQLDALKPLVVGTADVAGADSGQFSVRFMQVKRQALAASSSSTDLFSALAAGAHAQMEPSGIEGDAVTVVQLELPVGGGAMPITLAVPASAEGGSMSIVAQCIDALAAAAATVSGTRSWQ